MAEKHANELAKGQIDINKEQAKHPSIFVSGARPSNNVGLLSWFIMAVFYWGPILTWFAVMFNPDLMPPSLEMEGLVTLVMSSSDSGP